MSKRKKQPKGLTRKQISRARREARIQRTVLIGTGVVLVVVIGLIGFAILNDLVIKPGQAIAWVGDEKITLTEFQDYMKFEYTRITGGTPPEELGLDDASVSQFAQSTLDVMISNEIIQLKAAELGVEVSDDEVQEEIELAFGYDSGDTEPTPTGLPATAEPSLTPTFVYTRTPIPTPTLEPGITPTPSLTPTPTPSEEPTPTPTLAPTATPEPLTQAQYETNFDEYVKSVADVTGLSTARVERLIYEQVRMSMLTQRLADYLNFVVDETEALVHAAHILIRIEEIDTTDLDEEAVALAEQEAQEAALAAILAVQARLEAGEEFELLAAELSEDTSNAYKGGDLGWFGTGRMVAEFEEAAFSLLPGEISNPVLTDFGYHLIKLYERNDAAPLSEAEIESLRDAAFQEQITIWRAELGVEVSSIWLNNIPDLP
nr:peptidylprolyl isomerase [Anaerolineae bacterium]